MYDSRQRVVLEGAEPAVVASLLKLFLRELPHPVLTLALMPRFEEYAAFKEPAKRLAGFKALVEQLPEANRCLLEWIFCHMGKHMRLFSMFSIFYKCRLKRIICGIGNFFRGTFTGTIHV
jgi:hypothetical protein